MLSTIFHNSWQSGRVNLIYSPDIADGMNKMLNKAPEYMYQRKQLEKSTILHMSTTYSRQIYMKTSHLLVCSVNLTFGHSTTVNVCKRIGENHLAPPCIPRG